MEKDFYKKAQDYWDSQDATVNGMLGGFSQISTHEITSSRQFLSEIYKLKPCPTKSYAVDCGAGIGRVSKSLLIPFFDKVDLVEQCPAFATEAVNYIGQTEKLGEIYNVGLQDFEFEDEKYDVIWAQWVLGHLTDDDLVDFFKRAVLGLKKNGVIVVKENFASMDVEVDEVDSSVTRPLKLMKELIKLAGLRIIKIRQQTKMPKGLFAVHMIAMKPQ